MSRRLFSVVCDWLNTVIEHDPVHELRTTIVGLSVLWLFEMFLNSIAGDNRTAICFSLIVGLLAVWMYFFLSNW